MPSEHPIISELQLQQDPQSHSKHCSICHIIVDPTHCLYLSPAELICSTCKDNDYSARSSSLVVSASCSDIESSDVVRVAEHHQSTRRAAEDNSPDLDVVMDSPTIQTAAPNRHVQLPAPPKPTLQVSTTTYSQADNINHSHRNTPSSSCSSSPLTDITRLRVRTQTHHCLYPGAVFQGTQKSGRNSYDVNVTIVDVDFSTSFLCGYLRIRGLTDDWPELTTYFDAEIIGNRYGFLTENWGATEEEDMTHWNQFTPFERVKHDLQQPNLTMGNLDRGVVFMRWKERFLVPDHRVQDINGASFAGFYYVCVDFHPQTPSSKIPEEEEEEEEPYSPPAKTDVPIPRTRRNSSQKPSSRSRSSTRRAVPPVATMSGYYFHQNSEPYQHLSLHHVPERRSSTFEFR